MVTIYALLDNNQIRFIGKTTKVDLHDKLEQHLREAVTKPEKFGWISHLLAKGQTLEIKPVLSFNDEDAAQYEKLFLDHYKFFVGLKMNALEASISQHALDSMQGKKIDSLKTAI